MALVKAAKKATAAKPRERMTLKEAMAALEKAGSAQARKTYARHGAVEPMFGVAFGFLKKLLDRIGVDHELALALWKTGNFDARNLAAKIVDPARLTSADLDRWAKDYQVRMCAIYVSALAAEGPHGPAKAKQWLASKQEHERRAGWGLVAMMASRDEATPDSWFADQLARIEKTIHAAPNLERETMNSAVIAIGGRNASLRKAALAAAQRIGPVTVDHGDTACKTADAAEYIAKTWARCAGSKFDSPAAAERARESMRTRC